MAALAALLACSSSGEAHTWALEAPLSSHWGVHPLCQEPVRALAFASRITSCEAGV